EFRLFPSREVPAFVVLVVEDELGICAFRPAPWSRIELVGEDAYGHGDGDAFDTEIRPFAEPLPIETGTRKGCVRQPGDRDVVEDVVGASGPRLVRQKRVRSARSWLRRGPGNKPPG